MGSSNEGEALMNTSTTEENTEDAYLQIAGISYKVGRFGYVYMLGQFGWVKSTKTKADLDQIIVRRKSKTAKAEFVL